MSKNKKVEQIIHSDKVYSSDKDNAGNKSTSSSPLHPIEQQENQHSTTNAIEAEQWQQPSGIVKTTSQGSSPVGCFPSNPKCPNGYFDNFEKKCKCFRYVDPIMNSECAKLSENCPNRCQNGICIAPGHCSCDDGYSLSKSNKCEPICKDGCENGYCLVPNWCACNNGYTRIKYNTCSPICRNGCENGVCIAPEKCMCNDGYLMSKANKCEQVCTEKCENGTCSDSGKCSCNEGYSMSKANKCEPVCPGGCENGVCIAPGKCSCNYGYLMSKNNKCLPYCDGYLDGNYKDTGKCVCAEMCTSYIDN